MNYSPTNSMVQPELGQRTRSSGPEPPINKKSIGLNKISPKKFKVTADDVFKQLFDQPLESDETTGILKTPST